MYYWKINTGQIYGAEEGKFIEELPTGAELTPLYSDTSDPTDLVLADKAYLRQTVLFYGLRLGDSLKNRLDKI